MLQNSLVRRSAPICLLERDRFRSTVNCHGNLNAVQNLQVTCSLRIFACLDDQKARRHGTCEVRTGGESPPGVDSGVILVGDFSFAYDIKMMLDCVQIVKTGKEEGV